MLLATDLAVLDHAEGTVVLIANAVNYDGSDERRRRGVRRRRRAARRDDRRPRAGRAGRAPRCSTTTSTPAYTSNRTREDYLAAVERAKEEIRAGEAFQIVVSQRFEMPTTASALDIYRVLRRSNPSPYMYLFRFDGFDVVGSSPEALVKVDGRRALLHPIAGSRWRGATPEEDNDARRRAARRREGARRAPHARRPRPQRPRPRLRAGHASRSSTS